MTPQTYTMYIAPLLVLFAGLLVGGISFVLIKYIFPYYERKRWIKDQLAEWDKQNKYAKQEELDLADEAAFYTQMEEALAEKFYDQDGVIYGGWAIPWLEVGPFRRSSYINRARLAISFVEEYGSGEDE